ncbi:MAG: glycoside hydrolase family 99-like domain-containing protein [Bacilli bacterium]|nr:glycoside hydrolase family 99-like domain-containing protein [Bacilli bacterium]
MKALAIYLPQYHEIEENNKWWGKGFTEWNTVKSAVKYLDSQYQPKEPLEKNYYYLDDPDAKAFINQVSMAKENGIYGFCFYHYWFKGNKKMLQLPMEIFCKHKEIEFPYCICWANEAWRRTWYAGNSEILIEQEYGGKADWETHYRYLSSFFKDKRYIKIDNKPLVVIYRTAAISDLNEMLSVWNCMAKEDGFDGIYLISERTSFEIDRRSELFDAYCDFEPAYSLRHRFNVLENFSRIIKRRIASRMNSKGVSLRIENVIPYKRFMKYMGKDKLFLGKKVFPGVCPGWDNTPRKGTKGMFLSGSSPELYRDVLKDISKRFDDDTFLFINAWNEWSEGAYLEPDSLNEYAYLRATKEGLNDEKKAD